MRSVMSMLAVCGLLAMVFPQYSEAAENSIPCTAEPTDMTIHYGEHINCTIGPIGADSDTFRFSGRAGDNVILVLANAGRFSRIQACVDLYAPPACEHW